MSNKRRKKSSKIKSAATKQITIEESEITEKQLSVEKVSEEKVSQSIELNKTTVAEEKKMDWKRIWAVFTKRLPVLYFPVIFLYLEIVFHIYQYRSMNTDMITTLMFSFAYGILASVLTSAWNTKVNRIAAWVITGLTCVAFNLQLVYAHIFKTYISVYSVQQNAGDATEFFGEAVHGIIECLPGVILMLVIPLVLLFLCIRKRLICHTRSGKKLLLLMGGCTIGVYSLALIILPLNGRDEHTSYDLYHNNWILDLGVEKLGIMTSMTFDVKNVLFGTEEDVELDETLAMSSLVLEKPTSIPTAVPVMATPIPSLSPQIATPGTLSEPTETPLPTCSSSPTPTPIDTSPNVLDIDFMELASEEKDDDIRELHEYMAASEPTKKNKYTGMFKDYNLIYMVAEGFSPWAVDKEVTPTLYKMVNEGFVFNNFYTPIWYTSTSDGEYVACTGLIPYSTNSFKRSKNNALPFCFGWQFLKLGYTSRAWHAHTATYYGREYTHPNMGYIFKGKFAGLNITDVWPESDLEMMQLTVPEYINDENFHVYYMTVSGHLEYNFSGNTQSKKNKSYVENLPYSDSVKAYIACNKELDLAMEYLIKELERTGIADKTVIAFSADHYPYGLTNEQINEVAGHEVETNFELYKNNFVLWTGGLKEPIVIDKYCSSLDIMPTLSNLFGLEFDSRLFMGSDILSDAPALVIFSNQSFITDYCMYNSKTKDITMLRDVELPEGYISSVNKIVNNKFKVSKNILLKDYYRYCIPYIPGVVTEVPKDYDNE